jgi:Ala-tRNA(Pro) deacylase
MVHDSDVERNVLLDLDARGVNYQMIEHPPVYTCDVAARMAGHEPSGGIKSIFLKARPPERCILVCTAGDKKVDSKLIMGLSRSQRLRFATPGEVTSLTGLEIGCCSPFGYPKAIETYADKALLCSQFLFFNPGSHRKTIKIASQDFKLMMDEGVYCTWF